MGVQCHQSSNLVVVKTNDAIGVCTVIYPVCKPEVIYNKLMFTFMYKVKCKSCYTEKSDKESTSIEAN